MNLGPKLNPKVKKNPDFEAPEFSAGPTSRASRLGHKNFLDPKPFWVSSQCNNLDLHTPWPPLLAVLQGASVEKLQVRADSAPPPALNRVKIVRLNIKTSFITSNGWKSRCDIFVGFDIVEISFYSLLSREETLYTVHRSLDQTKHFSYFLLYLEKKREFCLLFLQSVISWILYHQRNTRLRFKIKQ